MGMGSKTLMAGLAPFDCDTGHVRARTGRTEIRQPVRFNAPVVDSIECANFNKRWWRAKKTHSSGGDSRFGFGNSLAGDARFEGSHREPAV